ncbi:MAG: YcxB family protein [Candidatus Accumulibacter sp.]|jgi:hypothetical protein|nr:YcxB family protein [Accumulibacter sp.]
MPDLPLSYRLSPEIMGEALLFNPRQDAKQIRFVLLAIMLGAISSLAYRTDYWPVFLMTILAAYILYRVLYLSRLRRKVSEEWGEVSLLFREEGLEITHSGAKILYSWPHVREIREISSFSRKTPRWIAIVMNSAQGLALPVPLAAFANEGEKQAFLEAVRARIAGAPKDERIAELLFLSYRVAPEIMGMALSFNQWQEVQRLPWLCAVLTGIVALLSGWAYLADFVIIFLAAYVLYRILYFSRLRCKASEELGKVSLLLREEGLEITHSGAKTLYFWPHVREIRVTRKVPEVDYWPLWPCIRKIRAMRKLKERVEEKAKARSWIAVIMNSTQETVLPVPLSAFASEEEEQVFMDTLRAKIKSAQKNAETEKASASPLE